MKITNNYETPSVKVVPIEAEQAVMSGSFAIERIGTCAEDQDW